MSFIQKDGEYPRLDLPEEIGLSPPYSYTTYRSADEEYPYLENLPEAVGLTEPFPYLVYSLSEYENNGYPRLKFLGPEIMYSPPVEQAPYICVFDMHAEQESFDTNGICVLQPTVCEITEELNGMYELYMEHPIDAENRWKYLLELNIIKAKDQLFRIYKKNTKLNSDGSRIRVVYARHIFYDLADKIIMDARPENKDGLAFINWIMNHISDDGSGDTYPQYDYSWWSDIEKTATSYIINQTPVEALIGSDNCFINRLGGELYRNNFYFSLNEHMEGYDPNAFEITYSVDMIDVEEDIDYSEFITRLIASDNFGQTYGVSYAGSSRLHHAVSRALVFNYEEPNFDQLVADTNAYFSEYAVPKVSYKVNYADLTNSELYAGFYNLQRCNVGDYGHVYCEELGITTYQKVIKKKIDVLNGKTTSIELGNRIQTLTRSDKVGNITSGNSQADIQNKTNQEATNAAIAATIKTWADANNNYKWRDLFTIKWEALNNEDN